MCTSMFLVKMSRTTVVVRFTPSVLQQLSTQMDKEEVIVVTVASCVIQLCFPLDVKQRQLYTLQKRTQKLQRRWCSILLFSFHPRLVWTDFRWFVKKMLSLSLYLMFQRLGKLQFNAIHPGAKRAISLAVMYSLFQRVKLCASTWQYLKFFICGKGR